MNRRGISSGIVSSVVFVAFEAMSVTTVMPVIARQLHALGLYGWAFSIFMIASVFGILIATAISSRSGIRSAYVGGIVIFGLGLVGAAASSGMAEFLASRFVQGLGAGAVGSMSVLAIGKYYPESDRPRMTAVMSSAWVIPSLVGPAVAGLVAQSIGWRWVFAGLVPFVVISGFIVSRVFSPRSRPIPSPVDDRPSASIAHESARLAISIGRYLLPRKSARRGVDRRAVSAIAVRAMTNWGFFGAEAFLPLALTSVHKFKLVEAGLVITASSISWTIGAWLQARKHRTWGRAKILALGTVFLGAGIAGCSLLVFRWAPAWLAPVSWTLAGLGMGMAYTLVTVVVLDRPAGETGEMPVASLQVVDVLGTALGTGIGGALLAAAIGVGFSVPVGVGLADASCLAAILVCVAAGGPLLRATS